MQIFPFFRVFWLQKREPCGSCILILCFTFICFTRSMSQLIITGSNSEKEETNSGFPRKKTWKTILKTTQIGVTFKFTENNHIFWLHTPFYKYFQLYFHSCSKWNQYLWALDLGEKTWTNSSRPFNPVERERQAASMNARFLITDIPIANK